MTRRPAQSRGFTLVEVLVGATLGALAMTALLSCFVFLARNFSRLAHAQALEEQARRALAWVAADVESALAIKAGTTPTATTFTLTLPAGEVTYTYDAAGFRLRRQASFGASPDLALLTGPDCRLTDCTFAFATGSLGPPTDHLAPTVNVPYSIKHLRLAFTLRTPPVRAAATQMEQVVVSPWLVLRQRTPPDGT